MNDLTENQIKEVQHFNVTTVPVLMKFIAKGIFRETQDDGFSYKDAAQLEYAIINICDLHIALFEN